MKSTDMLWRQASRLLLLLAASCGAPVDPPAKVEPPPSDPAPATAPAPAMSEPPAPPVTDEPVAQEPSSPGPQALDALPEAQEPPPRLVILPPEPAAPTPASPVVPPETRPPAKEEPLRAEDHRGRPGRPLPEPLRDLLESLRDNDMEESSRRLRKLPARGLAPQDALLAELLTSYVHWRLGEDDKAETLLGKAHAQLRQSRGLDIKSLLLVEPRTMAYGVYTPHENRRYTLKETLWLYVEPVNVRQEETPDGFRLSLAVDFTLRDSRGNSVHDMERVRGREFEQICNDGLKNKVSRNRRSDLWYYFKIVLPSNLNPGDYILEIRLVDLVADPARWTKSQVSFTVE